MKKFARSALVAASVLTALAAHAEYPDRPIKILVPSFPGSPPDLLTRVTGQALAKQLGQAVVVENKGGAGGNIGMAALVAAPADGYTLSYVTNGIMTTNEALFSKLTYDPRKLAPVGGIATTSSFLLVSNDVPAKTVGELVNHVKHSGKEVQYGSGGPGSTSHLGAELFKTKEGLEKAIHIPYKGQAPAMQDLIAGRLHYLFDNIVTSAPQVTSGRVRPIAVTSKERSPLFPDVPTLKESSVNGFVMNAWGGLVAPEGTPEAVISKVNKALNEALKDPAVIEQLSKMAFIPLGGSPADFKKLADEDRGVWLEVARQSGARVE